MKKLIITSIAIISVAGITSYSLLTQPNEEQMKQTTNTLTVDGYVEPITNSEDVQAPEVVDTVTNPSIETDSATTPVNEPTEPIVQSVSDKNAEARAYIENKLNDTHLGLRVYLVYASGRSQEFNQDKDAFIARCLEIINRRPNVPSEVIAAHYHNPNF